MVALATVVVWPLLLPVPYIIAAFPILLLVKRRPLWFGVGLGLLYGQLACHYVSTSFQPISASEVELVARLSSAPSGAALYQRSQWLVESVSEQPLAWYQNKRIELGWYQPPPLRLGQRYRLIVKFKPPSGYLNIGGFNRYRHQLSKGIGASGYVKSAQLVDEQRHWRQPLLADLAKATEPLSHGAVLRALVLADKRDISQPLWQQMRQAGLIHLLAISGLHLSIVAGGTLLLMTAVRQRLFANPYGRGRAVVWVVTAMIALGYATLAQMGLPTMRATLAVLLTLILLWQKRQGRPWEILVRVAAVVLLVQPLASLAPGFWLSFGAIVLILFSLWLWPRHDQPKWLVLLRVQLVLTLGMVVIQGVWFGEYSLHGIWTNMLALPYFSLLVLPGCLILALAFFAGAPAQVLLIADWLLTPIVWLAELASSTAFGFGAIQQNSLLLLLSLLAIGLLCWWRRWVSAAVIVLASLSWAYVPKPLLQLDMIDVGQGLAVLIQHNNEMMLVDTGAAFASGFSYAEAAIKPVLTNYGVERLRWLVVSHGDNDHAGGVPAIKGFIEVERHIGSGGSSCLDGPSGWGQLQLSWFQGNYQGNDGSCVLLIEAANTAVLLPGDIEAAGELAWLKQLNRPKVDLVVAPHHGSATSSSEQFVAATSPEWVLFAAGRNNRWGFPAESVVQRYQQNGSKPLVSGDLGQIRISVDADGEIRYQSYRNHWAPWWYNQQ